MDLNLFTAPGAKPLIDITANSYKITGDGSFGSNGDVIFVSGIGRNVAFDGYAPTRKPFVAANTLEVGSTFTGAMFGLLLTKIAGSQITIELDFKDIEIFKAIVDVPDTPPFDRRPFRLLFDSTITSTGVNGTSFGTYTFYMGGNNAYPVPQIFQSRGNFSVDTTIDNDINVYAGWDIASPDNVLLITNAWMRRVI